MRHKVWPNLIMICGLVLAVGGPGTGVVAAMPFADSEVHTTWQHALENAIDESSAQGESLTPWQRAFGNAIDERRAAGLPVPASVTYDQVITVGGTETKAADMTAPNRTIKVIATTIVYFDGPEQAGYDKWPALVVEDNLPPDANGTVMAGDYTETYREFMEDKFPGIWEQYEFGYEPRKHTITETFEVTFPEENLLAPGSMSVAETESIEEQILMGFTYTGPHLDYAIEDSLEVCVWLPFVGDVCITVSEFKAGFELDWALGLRLPAEASLIGPDQMVQGSPYSFSSALTPLDWSGTQYTDAGVAAESGNEFVLRLDFFVGLHGELFGVDLCPSCYVEVNIDRSTSFTTPFGPGAYFPIPPVEIPIYEFDLEALYFGAGLEVDPNLGSDKVTADWQASGDASGSGQITFSEPGVPVTFGPVNACNLDPANEAQIQLTEFRYWFNQFLISLSAYLQFELFGFGVWNPTFSIAEFDLSPLTGDMYLGAHTQCDWDFSCSTVGPDNSLDLSILVVDQDPPTTSIALSGTAGSNDWYVSDVEVTLSATDNPPGCGTGVERTEYSFDGVTWDTYTAPFTLTDEGIATLYYRSIDVEGNTETMETQVIKIDKTPPVITGAATTPPNAYGWYNTDVVVHFSAFDAVSGIDTVTPDQVLSAEGADQSVTGTATDMAGNSASTTVSGISIDKTSPTISITSPEAKDYENTETFHVVWTVTDSLSGVATEDGWLDGDAVTNGQLIELLLLAPGWHVVTVDAMDKADNAAAASVTFGVITDIDGLLAATERVCELGWISKHGVCNALEAKVNAAKASIERGRYETAQNQLEAFVNQLDSQQGKAINQEAYELLLAIAQYVIDHL